MLNLSPSRIAPVLSTILLSACPDRLVPGELDPAITLDPGESTTTAPSTTTGLDPTTTTTTTTGLEPTTTTTDAPAACGPPCPAVWTHPGNLILGAQPRDLTCMSEVEGDLWIGADASLATIATLANLERVAGELTISGAGELTDLASFACLREVAALSLSQLPQLLDISALAKLRAAARVDLVDLGIAALPDFAPEFAGIDSLILRDLPALVDLDAASTWGPAAENTLTIQIAHASSLTGLTGLAGLLAANGPRPVHLELDQLPALTSLAGLESLVSADLHLSGLPLVGDFAPLAQLERGGQISFNDIPGVHTLTGLGALTEVGTLTIGDCVNIGLGGMDGLTSLGGLSGLKRVHHLALAGNDNLTSLAGAPQLHDLDGLAVVDNPALSQPAYDAFLAQIDSPPWSCLGGWDLCQCFIVIPG